MGRLIRSGVALAAAGLLFATAVSAAVAQSFPNRPITLVVPFSAGGGNDTLARAVAERMSKSLGQQVVVENRGGAGGTIATRAVSRSEPDGYTILLTYTGTLAINPSLYPNAGYDPRKDFAPIGLIAELPGILVINPKVPANDLGELIAHAKANPGKLNYGFVPGTVGHITTEMFASRANIEMARIPYKGNGSAMGDLIGGHVSMMFISILPAIGPVRGNQLRALAVTSPQRSEILPEVPTIAEAGLAGFSAGIRYGLSAPPTTPRPIIDRLSTALREAVLSEELGKRLRFEGGRPIASTPEEYAADIDADEKRWGPLVKTLNLKFD